MSNKQPIPIERFGRDHWSTLAYLETRMVDAGGRIENCRMRCDRLMHPDKAHMPPFAGKKYPTRLKDGEMLVNHDDWNCIDDMVSAGLVTTIDGNTVELTPLGWNVSAQLRRAYAGKSNTQSVYDSFTPELS